MYSPVLQFLLDLLNSKLLKSIKILNETKVGKKSGHQFFRIFFISLVLLTAANVLLKLADFWLVA